MSLCVYIERKNSSVRSFVIFCYLNNLIIIIFLNMQSLIACKYSRSLRLRLQICLNFTPVSICLNFGLIVCFIETQVQQPKIIETRG